MLPSFYWPTGSLGKHEDALFSLTDLSFGFYLSVTASVLEGSAWHALLLNPRLGIAAEL